MSTTTYPRTDPAGKPWPAYMGKKDFAQRVLTRSPSYVTQLGDAGRLLLHPNGKWVDVQASLDRIEATTDPAKQAVADRHASARAANTATPAASPQTASSGQAQAAEDGTTSDGEGLDNPLYDFHGSKAKDAFYVAEMRKVEYLKLTRELVPCGDVVSSYADAGAAIRAAVDAWSADLPPMLAGQGEEAIRATLTDEVERLLADLAARFNRLSSAEVDG